MYMNAFCFVSKIKLRLFVTVLFLNLPNAFGQEPFHTSSPDETIADSFTRHEASFIAYGQPTTKGQLSFKLQPVRNFHFFIGYTQIMFWDLSRDSVPLQDINSIPELFYVFDTNKTWLKSIDLIPFWHKSNGKEGASSRGTNAFGLRLNGEKKYSDSLIKWNLGLKHFYAIENSNANLTDYTGPWELRLSYLSLFPSMLKGSELSVKIWGGGTLGQNLAKGGRELSIAIRVFSSILYPSLLLSVFDGYGESLLLYNQRSTNFRVGLQF